MKDKKQERLEIHHIGVVVEDMNRAVDYYSKFGLGPFRITEISRSSESTKSEPSKYKLKLAFAKMIGSMAMELIQVVDGNPSYRKFLEKHGEGMHHLAFIVDDADAETDKWAKQGIKIIKRGPGWSYLDFGYRTVIEFLSPSRILDMTPRLFPKT